MARKYSALNQSGTFGVTAFAPRQLNGCDQPVRIPIDCLRLEIELNQMRNSRIRSLPDVSLMVQFVPELIPRLRALGVRLQHGDKTTRIKWSSVSTLQLRPMIVS
jgi:hypothetical protein